MAEKEERAALPLQESERQPFEAYMLETGYSSGDLEKHGNGHYWNDEVSAAWWAWNRRAALAATPAVPQDEREAFEKLIPHIGGMTHFHIFQAGAEHARAALAAAPGCSKDPRAPHGFDRNASHNEGRYVCECESWSPDPALAATPAAPQPITDEQIDMATEHLYCDGRPVPAKYRIALGRIVERLAGQGKESSK